MRSGAVADLLDAACGRGAHGHQTPPSQPESVLKLLVGSPARFARAPVGGPIRSLHEWAPCARHAPGILHISPVPRPGAVKRRGRGPAVARAWSGRKSPDVGWPENDTRRRSMWWPPTVSSGSGPHHRYGHYAWCTPARTAETCTTPPHAWSSAGMNSDAPACGGVIPMTDDVGQRSEPETTSL